MTLNYKLEEEPPMRGLDNNTKLSLPACLVVGLGKTHGPALDEDARPYLGAVTNYVYLSERTKE